MHSRDPNKGKAKFQQEIDAILGGTSAYHRLKDSFDFTRFVFPEAEFTGEKFRQHAAFSRATFTQNTDFFHATFTQDADFDGAIFACPVSFLDAHFERKTRFHHAIFEKEAIFSAARFDEEVNFESATFKDKSYFDGVTFSQQARLHRVTFNQDARFGFATFMQDATFFMAKFVQVADFRGAKFNRNAIFSGTPFSSYANFEDATFSQKANFSWASFIRGARFLSAIFSQAAVFYRTVFGLRADAGAAVTPPALDSSPAIADFSWARFEQPGLVQFLQVNKESPQRLQARFFNCNIEGLQFVDVNWYKEGGRLVLQDELDITQPFPPQEQGQKQAEEHKTKPEGPYEVVATVYRQLVNNFEKVRAYDLAEDCSIGAMEMRRLDPAQPWFLRFVVTLYRWASNYGSSYVRAVSVLGILLLGFGLLFALPWAGIEARGTSTGESPSPALEIAKTLGRGLFHSLEVATFQRETLLTTTTWFGRLLAILQNVLVPAQLALLLLALRRRFRR